MRIAHSLAILVLALFDLSGCGGSGETDAADDPLGSAAQALNAPICVSIQRGVSGTVADAQIVSDRPTTNYGAKSATNINGGSVTRQLLLRFDVSSIPSNATVTSGSLTVTGYQLTFGASATLRAHRIIAPWTESAVTWGLFNGGFSPVVEASAVSNKSVATPASFDVKPLVAGWVSGAFANQGVLLEQAETTTTGIGTSESAIASSRPKLDVCYLPFVDTGETATAMVSAGAVSKSGKYTMVHTLGQSTQNQGKATSAQHRLQGGLAGANGTIP